MSFLTVGLFVYFTSFHSVNGIFFTFPSQYLYTIDQLYVLRVLEWSPNLQAVFRADYFTFINTIRIKSLDLHQLSRTFIFLYLSNYNFSYSISLATTFEITIVFYSRVTKMVQFTLFVNCLNSSCVVMMNSIPI